jgi:hypothetical protein
VGKHWTRQGLDGSVVNCMRFIPEIARR